MHRCQGKDIIGGVYTVEQSKGGNSRLLTIIIIVISTAGVLYFGYKAVQDNTRKDEENPFEYNIERFKKSDSSLHHYTEVKRIELEFLKSYAIAVDAADNIFVSGDRSVVQFDQSGSLKNTIDTAEPVRCLAADKNGDLYLGMMDHIEVYSPDGSRKTVWEPLGEKAIITSLALSGNEVYAADAGNRVVWKYGKSGKILAKIGEKNAEKGTPGYVIPSPYFDVCVDSDGFLWAANTGRHSLENYNSEGSIRSFWGEYSMAVEGFSGCCNPSHFVILDDGSFVTSEKGIARVKVYNRIGKLISVVAGPDKFYEGTVGLDLAKDSQNRIYVLDPKLNAVRIFEK